MTEGRYDSMMGVAQPFELLLVEDDDELRDALVDALALHGYHVVTAINGSDALTVIRQGQAHPCVILLDLMMPVMDGVSFLQHHAIDPSVGTVPVVVLTAKGAVAETLVDTVVAVLPKPVPMTRLLEILRTACQAPEHLATSTRSLREDGAGQRRSQERRLQCLYPPRTQKPSKS
jgi:CheY-like chemotaxis protein